MIINNIANINFGGGGGGETAKLQEKEITLSAVTATVVPDDGYDGISKLNYSAITEEQHITVSTDSEYLYIPSKGKVGFSKIYVKGELPNVTNLDDGVSFGFSTFTSLPQMNGGDNRTSYKNLFYNCQNLESVDFSITTMGSGNLTDVSYMFYGCETLSAITNISLDLRQITDCSYMFYNCKNLIELELNNSAIGALSSINNMSYMFYGCEKLQTLKLYVSGYQSAANTDNMFFGCATLTTIDVSSCNEYFQNKILNQLENDFGAGKYTLNNGIISRTY